MKKLMIPLSNSKKPKYQLLADALRSSIRSGRLKPGERLPSTRELGRTFKMHRHTVMGALSELESEGWIVAYPKKYFQVTNTLPSAFLRPIAGISKIIDLKEPTYRIVKSVRVHESTSEGQYQFTFMSGKPDLRLFPIREFKSHHYDALKSKSVLGYGSPSGHPRLMSQISTYLRRVRAVDRRSVIVTNGSQEAIFLLAQILIQAGDAVAIEAMGYPPAVEALRFAGAKLYRVNVDAEGLIVDELEKLAKKKKIRLLYTTPLHQYPTTVTLSASRRLKLYEVAYRHNILILEDDYDHEFHYVSQPVAPLASFDPAQIVLYVSTFSKILFPSARLGFMAVPGPIANEVAKLKRISSRQNEHIMQDSVARFMESGGFEKHLRKMRRIYEERRNLFVQCLQNLREKCQNISWTVPDGGMALWLNTCKNSQRIFERAKRDGILVHPEANYRLDGGTGTHLRLGFSGQTPEENRAGLERLFRIL